MHLKKIYIFLSLIIVGATACIYNPPKETAKTVLIKAKKTYEQHTSLSYKIDYRIKFLDEDDTVKVKADCKLIRQSKDTIFNGYVWYKTYDTVERYYDLHNIYLVEHNAKKITEFNTRGNRKRPIVGNVAGDVIDIYFLTPQKLLSVFEDTSTAVVMLPSTQTHYVVQFKIHDEEGFTDMNKTLWVRKKNFLIDKITFQAKFQENYQYSEWNLQDMQFDKVTVSELNETFKSFVRRYSYEMDKPRKDEVRKRLADGTSAPDFNGRNFGDNKKVSLTDYKGKITVLDFFYIACMPCLKAVPMLAKIRTEFSDKEVAILGMNSFDIEQIRRKRLSDFVKTNGVNYPVILTERTTDNLYSVQGYPTLYVVDASGKIIFSDEGFSEHLYDTLKAVLKDELRQ